MTFKKGDRVRITVEGGYKGELATVISQERDLHGKLSDWYSVKMDIDGHTCYGPASWMEEIQKFHVSKRVWQRIK